MRKKQVSIFTIIIAAVLLFASQYFDWPLDGKTSLPANGSAEITLYFPADRYPETGLHIKEAIAAGESEICTIDREHAEQRRKESLRGIPTKKGYDRDEWPMAMCAEGGKGADVKYIDPSDNRGAGSWVSNQLESYPNGTRVLFVVK
ncbi:DNA-entry nuclease [Paenibacillus sp. GCM10027626]|uniref:NucA/NucB deoxyribonuclease domain-containing protein n=1 Tax=Paenibacillus sp. GCM10027626 TaxID=3273411 RepID=UPI00362727EF